MNFFIDDFCWSYSRLQAFKTCKHMFYLEYIKSQRKKKIDGFFGLFGTYCHVILEKYAKEELLIFELYDYYKRNYKRNIKMKAPPNKWVNLDEKYFNAGAEYFKHFSGFDDYKILGIEENHYFNIENFKFRAIIDLLLQDENENIIILDHKTKGKLTKKQKEELLLQLYIYSIPIIEKYGKYPKKLIFNMIRMNDAIIEEFDPEKIELAKNWALNMIGEIRREDEWEGNLDFFFCKYICSHRTQCKYLKEIGGNFR